MRGKEIAIFFAISAAIPYAINIPVSKVLLRYMGPTMPAASLYLGAGPGLLAYRSIFKGGRSPNL